MSWAPAAGLNYLGKEGFFLIKPIDNADALNRCHDLYQRGEYAARSRILTRRLSGNPVFGILLPSTFWGLPRRW